MGATTVPATTKTPSLAWEVMLGQAPRSSSGRKRIVVVSPQNAIPGTATANTLYQLYDATTAATLGGYGCPAHRMRIAMAEADKNVEVWGVFAADATAKTQGTGTMAITGTTASESKVMRIRIGDTTVLASIVTGDTPTIVGTAMVAAINGDTSLPVAAAGTITVTLTPKANGTGDTSIEWYVTDVAAGITVGTPAGACSTGTGVPLWSAAFAAIEASTKKFSYIVPASATLADLNTGTGNLRDRIGADALASVKKRMQVVLASKDSQGNAATFSSGFDKGTVAANETGPRFSVVWFDFGLVEEWVMAARWCATRCGMEEVDPNVNLGGFGGIVIPGAVPPPVELGSPLAAEIEAALNQGCSPVTYDYEASTVTMVLSITCKDTTGGDDDYRAWCTGKITTLDYLADDLEMAEYDAFNGFKLANDGPDGKAPSGLKGKVTTPRKVGNFVCDRLNEVNATFNGGLIEDVKRSDVTTERNVINPRRLDHWADVSVVPWLLQGFGELHEVSP